MTAMMFTSNALVLAVLLEGASLTVNGRRATVTEDARLEYVDDGDPTRDAPPLTDADAPDEWEETGIEYRPFEREPEESYDPYWIGESIVPDDEAMFRETFRERESFNERATYYTQEDIDKATLAADQSAFERGYGSAVDDYRHGLWADEVDADVEAARARSYTEGFNDSTDEHAPDRERLGERLEAARYNETSFRTTLLDVQQWMAFEVEDIDRAVGHDRILSEVNETLSMDPMLGITPEGTDSMEQGARWE